MEINNSKHTYKPAFEAFWVKNTSWSKAKKYAGENGLKEEFKSFEKIILKYPSDNIELMGRHNKTPNECNRVVVKLLDSNKKLKNGFEFLKDGSRDIGEVLFETYKSIANNTSEIYKKLYNI